MTDAVRSRILSPETLVPVGVLAVLLGPLVAGTWMASATFHGISARLESLEAGLNRDRWSYSMERDTWKEFQVLNPAIKIPDYRRIHSDNNDTK